MVIRSGSISRPMMPEPASITRLGNGARGVEYPAPGDCPGVDTLAMDIETVQLSKNDDRNGLFLPCSE